MRTCFQHGLGAKQFANALRVQQLQQYDELHLQYLYFIKNSHSLHSFLGHCVQLFLPFENHSPNGFAGFVPSAQWLRDLYNAYIEDHAKKFNQHTAMLSADILAIDHSFKAPKQITKINGEQAFIGLLTGTNERGEIRLCNLVAMKAHSQFEMALRNMSNLLTTYGHSQPALMYTDNMSDQGFLKQVFPSLQEGVSPIEKHSQLESLEVPSNVVISHPLQSTVQINNAMRSIIQLLPDYDSSFGADKDLVIGLDTEYNVEVSSHRYVTGQGQTAIIQIACGNNIFILQIGAMIASGCLPIMLKQVLSNPCIIKVGRNVGADLQYLESAVSASPKTFVGTVDLGKMTKECLVSKDAWIGLADLCALMLGKCLNKNVPECISDLWENDTLSEAQICYAALDAYASLCIYQKLLMISVPSPLPLDTSPAPSTPILLYSSDKSCLIAQGCVSHHYGADEPFNGINVTKMQCVIEVSDVLVPGAKLPIYGSKKLLSSFGTPLFHMVCLKSHLRLAPPPSPSLSQDLPSHNGPSSSPSSFPSSIPTDDLEDAPGTDSNSLEKSVASMLDDLESTASSSLSLSGCSIDEQSQELGDEIIKKVASMPWDTTHQSWVKKDAFHIFHQFYLPAAHGCRVDFVRAFWDSLFLPDQGDKSRIESWGAKQQPLVTYEYLLCTKPKWVLDRCKRVIPPPEQLYPLVAKVFNIYGSLKDAKSGAPLFNKAAWGVAQQVLELIRKGFLSDPLDIALYKLLFYERKTGLPIYRCLQGTNFTEGGVGTFNSTGLPWQSHYDIRLINCLHEILLTLEADGLISNIPEGIIPKGWINGNFYVPSTEVFGILPIPEALHEKSGMVQYNESIHRSQTHCHTGSSEPPWEQIVRSWNASANQDSMLSYKLIEHLRLYYNGTWKSIANVKQTYAETTAA
ncbi:hypothetical protein GYMLUDRAFT_250294 [Collybiopsis luxurians FD-317 M1]|uniref:3'-5' exonuclease domain-containing protein n=1 Tax=Collybiopsis luxurians FD-317 M1 TaxID=944289 RepID=A0A0D0C6W1_9AGAR|nr:hypothetical protein GYMLUDRAFT_250294 [Collybiopsis luxurians FD-317 M1]